jgi:hypothetical protein
MAMEEAHLLKRDNVPSGGRRSGDPHVSPHPAEFVYQRGSRPSSLRWTPSRRAVILVACEPQA